MSKFNEENTRTADVVDHGSEIAEQINAGYVKAQRAKCGPDPFDPDFDGEHCVECAAALPPQRLIDGRVRCTECQTLLERQQAQFRR